MRKIILSLSFFIMTPALLLVSIVFYLSLSYNQTKNFRPFSRAFQPIAFAALPSSENVVEDFIESKNINVEKVRQFFAKYHSPLEPYAQDVINAANEYDLDYRLIPAIAMQESNLCKKAPAGSHNCWGYGMYSKKIITFDTYKDAIYTVTKTLATKYRENGLETPEQIMTKYNPSNHNNWLEAINYFMNVLK